MEEKIRNMIVSVTAGKHQKYVSVLYGITEKDTDTKEASMEGMSGNPEEYDYKSVCVPYEGSLKAVLVEMESSVATDEELAVVAEYYAKRDSMTDGELYAALSAAFIRQRFSEDDVEAIISNFMAAQTPSLCDVANEQEVHDEFGDFQSWRVQSKERAKRVISLMGR